MSASIESLHDKARRAIESGEHKFREAAEYLFKARELGASQRDTARAIGKSTAWVNRLLKWRDRGYTDTPFGPQSKKSRASAVEASKRARATSPEQAQAQTAKAEAVKAKAELQTARALAAAAMFPPETKRIPSRERVALIKALQMLGSHAYETITVESPLVGAGPRSSHASRCPGRRCGPLGRGCSHARRRAWRSRAG
jgi:hypothetical protein